MKKILAVVCVSAVVLALAACGKFTCDMCGQEKSGGKHTYEMLGQKLTVCDDCYNSVKGVANSMSGLLGN